MLTLLSLQFSITDAGLPCLVVSAARESDPVSNGVGGAVGTHGHG
jgi:hypothetical protein